MSLYLHKSKFLLEAAADDINEQINATIKAIVDKTCTDKTKDERTALANNILTNNKIGDTDISDNITSLRSFLDKKLDGETIDDSIYKNTITDIKQILDTYTQSTASPGTGAPDAVTTISENTPIDENVWDDPLITELGIPMVNYSNELIQNIISTDTDANERNYLATIFGQYLSNSACRPLLKVFGGKVSVKNLLKAVFTNVRMSKYRRRFLKVVDNPDNSDKITVTPLSTTAMAEGIAECYDNEPIMESFVGAGGTIKNQILYEVSLFGFHPINAIKRWFNNRKNRKASQGTSFNSAVTDMKQQTLNSDTLKTFYQPIEYNESTRNLYLKFTGESDLNTTIDSPADKAAKFDSMIQGGTKPFTIWMPVSTKLNEVIHISNEPIINGYHKVNDKFHGHTTGYFVTADEKDNLFKMV